MFLFLSLPLPSSFTKNKWIQSFLKRPYIIWQLYLNKTGGNRPVSKYSCALRYAGLGLQHMNMGEYGSACDNKQIYMKHLEQYLAQSKYSINGSCATILPAVPMPPLSSVWSHDLPPSTVTVLDAQALSQSVSSSVLHGYPNSRRLRKPSPFCTPAQEPPWFPLFCLCVPTARVGDWLASILARWVWEALAFWSVLCFPT